MEFEFDIRGRPGSGPQRPFSMLVLGDFSGNGRTATGPAADRPILRLDLDTVDGLWSRFQPLLSLETDSTAIEIRPRTIEDFVPDRLYRTLPLFDGLKQLRERLLEPSTARAALDDLLAAANGAAENAEDSPAPAAEGADRMFERLLGKPQDGSGARRREPAPDTALESFVRGIVAPHIVPGTDRRAEAAIESVDRAAAEIMRRILHHPGFQRLEASWRSLTDLVTELELDESLQLSVCDISRSEMLAGLPNPGNSLAESGLFQLLVERRRRAADDTPWSVIIGDFSFDGSSEDVALLTALGAAAAANGAVFLAAARPRLLGCESPAQLADTGSRVQSEDRSSPWQALRRSPLAPHIGLALPRLLGRLPYGAETEPTDSFPFEEMPERIHEHYLWLNPAYACGRLLAQSYTRDGWRMQPGDHVDLGTLPAHTFEEDGQRQLQPCAEVLLPESAMVAIMEAGVMPLVSYRNQNTAVLGRFQSIADPARALAGPWSGAPQRT